MPEIINGSTEIIPENIDSMTTFNVTNSSLELEREAILKRGINTMDKKISENYLNIFSIVAGVVIAGLPIILYLYFLTKTQKPSASSTRAEDISIINIRNNV